MAKETAKDQGVPDIYLSDSGNFAIGMDARYKSDLVNSALGLITKAEPGDSKQVFEVKDAESRLEKRGWTPFLTRKKEIVETKAAKAEAAQKEREEKQREAAEAKAKKDAEKQAAKEAKAKEQAEAKAKKEAEKAAKGATSTGGESKADQARRQREEKAAAAGQ